MSTAFIVVAAVCGAIGAALWSPQLVAVGFFAIAASLVIDGVKARQAHRTTQPRATREKP